jgi:STE24 endopeptidase
MEESRKYERRKFAVTLAGFGIDLLLLVYLLASGWTFRIRNFADSIADSPWLVVLIYSVIVGAVVKLLQLPLSFYSGYWVEREFGLSRQSAGGWVIDQLKGFAIGMPLALGALEIGYFLFRAAPDWWWLYAGSIFVLFFVIMTKLAPVLLLPLFFKFRPIERADLLRMTDRLARRTETKICGVYEWSLGDKTRKANAAVVGWGNTRRIIVSDTLLQNFSLEEVEVIMAHEICHHVKNHIWQGMALQAGLTYIGFFLTQVLLGYFSGLGGFNGIADIANLPVLALISMGLSLLVLPGVNYFSRRLETVADAYALDITGDSLAFVSGMEKLAELNLANTSPHPFIEFMFYSHPSIEKRIRLAADHVQV